MCDYVPGRLLAMHAVDDDLAAEILERREGFSIHETMEDKLGRLDRKLDPRLKLRMAMLAVPEGDEVWWLGELTARYFSRAVGRPERHWQTFAVSLAHTLEPCAITFTLGPHDASYRSLMRESSSSGDGSGVKVKIIDSGLSTSSAVTPHTRVNILDVNKPTDVEDQLGHGTAVTEIIHELAPKAEFLVYKVKGAASSPPIIEWDVLAALSDNDSADVINLSLAFGLATHNCPTCGRLSHSSRSRTFEGILRRIAEINADTIIVAAAGNQGASALVYPARFRQAVAVGAVDSAGSIWTSSNYGNLDNEQKAHDSLFFAPGGGAAEIVGTVNPGGQTCRGTSFAAAYTSGLIAKLQSDASYKGTAANVLQSLRNTANQNPAMAGYVAADHGNGLLQL